MFPIPLIITVNVVDELGETVNRFLPAVSIVSTGSLVRVEDARYKLPFYRGNLFCDKLPTTSIDTVTDVLENAYDVDVDDGEWEMTDTDSSPGGAVANCAWDV